MPSPRNKGSLTAFWMPDSYRARLIALARKRQMTVSAFLRTLVVNAVETDSVSKEPR